MNRLVPLLLSVLLSIAAFAQNPAPQAPTGPIADANKLVNEGKLDDALAAYQKIAAADPKNWGYPGDLTEVMVHMREALNMLGY